MQRGNRLVERSEKLQKISYIDSSKIKMTDVNRVIHHIYEEDVLYITSKAHVLIIYCTDKCIYTRQYSMEDVVISWGKEFERVHKQYIVNMKAIDTYDRTTSIIRIKNHIIPVGRKYKQIFTRKFHELLCNGEEDD